MPKADGFIPYYGDSTEKNEELVGVKIRILDEIRSNVGSIKFELSEDLKQMMEFYGQDNFFNFIKACSDFYKVGFNLKEAEKTKIVQKNIMIQTN